MKNNDIQHSFDEFQQSIDRFDQKIDVFQKDIALIMHMGSTLDNCMAFLKEKGLLDEFCIYSLKKGSEEYRSMKKL